VLSPLRNKRKAAASRRVRRNTKSVAWLNTK
jgi:hypothetical protein